jgi:hypothetical protein
MTKILTLSLLAMSLFAGEAAKSPADVLYDKAVADNTRDAEKAYDAYVKALGSTGTDSRFAPCEHKAASGLEGTRLSRHQLSEAA